MSPEQCRGLRDVDLRSDVWSLGVIAFECLVGREPFRAETLAELLLKICMDPPPVPSGLCSIALPVGFDAWFAKAVARERAERFQSAEALLQAFAELRHPSTRRERIVPPALADEPARPPITPSVAMPRMPTERSTPFGLGVVVRQKKLEPRVKWSAAVALTLLFVVGAWQLLRLARAPHATGVGVEALQPGRTPTPAPALQPSAVSVHEKPAEMPPAAHRALAAPPPVVPSAAPSAPSAAPSAFQETPAKSNPPPTPSSPPKPAPAPPSPPRRRPPPSDIRTSR